MCDVNIHALLAPGLYDYLPRYEDSIITNSHSCPELHLTFEDITLPQIVQSEVLATFKVSPAIVFNSQGRHDAQGIHFEVYFKPRRCANSDLTIPWTVNFNLD